QLNHVTMRCHEWKCFAIISEDEGIKTVTPIAGTDENLAKFKITYGDDRALPESDISYIQLIEENGSYKDGVFEVYLYKPGQYRIYYGDKFVTVNSATPDVSFTSEEGTYSETEYSIIEEDPFSIGMGQVDEIDYYISTLDGSNTEEDGYYVNKITGIYVKEPKEPDENFNKYFTYKISDDGTSAKIHVDREVNLSEIIFGVTYDSSFYAKQADNSYAFDKNRSWNGDDEFHIYIENDERELVDLSEVKWNYTKAFEFDSKEKAVQLAGLSEVVDVQYSDNKKTDIGKYTATAELSIKEKYKMEYRLARQLPEEITSLKWEIIIPEKVQAVIDSIEALPVKAKVALTDKDKINEVKAAYEALSADEKAFIDEASVKKLTEAEAAIEALEKAAEKEAAEKEAEEKKTAADKAAAAAVNKSITDIPELSKITTADEAKIKAARAAYDALTADQKKLVSADDLKKLTAAEEALEKLKGEKQPEKIAPKVGTLLTYKKNTYKVNKVSSKKAYGEVILVKVSNKKAKSFSIEGTIEVDGYKYIVTSIGDNAFKNMTKMSKVSIPNSVTKIGNYAFKGCKALKTVKIPNKVKTLGTGVFQGCIKLTSVNFLGKNIKSIPKSAFSGCSKLNKIDITDNVTSIGANAFKGCKSLVSINVKSKKLRKVGTNALSGINKKAVINVPKGKKNNYTKKFKKKGQNDSVVIK
ncbi:MAG: leucine-rich repeat domain-containing protein, partial [Eubacterium sp.]|nr:leucine-rich repeat domain-containing protein [Eubacterium sp.]